MNNKKNRLFSQLIFYIGIIFLIIFLSIVFILPNSLTPIIENNIYNFLKQPLYLVDDKLKDNLASDEIAYIYLFGNNKNTSENFNVVLNNMPLDKVLEYTNKDFGKFYVNGRYYYYYRMQNNSISRISLTNDNYILNTRSEIIVKVFPIIIITIILISVILITWISIVVRRIERLKDKLDHIDDDSYEHKVNNTTDDEITSLEYAIEDMRISLKNQENYRNQMYQNISHDFKTPLTVIKSYIEATEDNTLDKDKALVVIKEQTNKLEQKVHSLLYLNKLDYIKDSNTIKLEKIDINNIIDEALNKFKYKRKDINFTVYKDKSVFKGTYDSWETIIDNILANFIRYAEKEIKITIKKDKIIFYNDGPNIEKDLLEGIFIPFRKGIKGEFGLGLSIVKKTLNFISYDILIKNEKKGVSFIIFKI